MNPSETSELMDNIVKIRDTFQIAILLIEHDMNLVMGICEGICVLNFGQVIAKGTPQEIQNNPEVIKAYLAPEGVSDAVSMLNVENINVYYGAIHAVKGVSFTVEEGEIITLIGAQRRRQVHHPEDRVRPAPQPHRLHHLPGGEHRASPPTSSSPRAWPRCPRAGRCSSR